MSPNDAALADRIRACVREAGGGNSFARATGIPRSTLETYISGKATPKPDRLAAICQILNINGHWLLTGEGEMRIVASPADLKAAISTIQSVARSLKPGITGDQQILLDAHKSATPEMAAALLTLAKAILAGAGPAPEFLPE